MHLAETNLEHDELIEVLADLAHKQWTGWMLYLIDQCAETDNGTMEIPRWAVSRWSRQVGTEYHELPENEKASDRRQARWVLEAIEKFLSGKQAAEVQEASNE